MANDTLMGRVIAGGFAALFVGSAVADDPYADRWISYDAGINPAGAFTDPTTALGEPTRVTVEEESFGGPVTPFFGPFGTDEIVSIGEGGHLTVAFDTAVTDDALNPFGIDLLIFGNAFLIDVDFPNGQSDGSIFGNGGTVSVSADGINFVEVTGVEAVGMFPTLGFTDPANQTGATDFTKPVDPSFDPAGLSLSEIIAAYDGSGGGVGIDIGALGLSEISYVRIENEIGSGLLPEIDGFSDVRAIPAPGGAIALVLGFGLTRRRR